MRLERLNLWLDTTPRSGPLNMALDEVMLLAAREPWMRVYQWSQPTISFGFSQEMDGVQTQYRDWPLVRRWTGGGLVVHDGDWTYTLAAPQGTALCEMRASESYQMIHEAMVVALHESGVTDLELQPESTSDGMGNCFVEPAKFDVVHRGQKIAGAGQRRAKAGFLHQGTVQPIEVPEGFAEKFARHLAMEVHIVAQSDAEAALLQAAQDLVPRKYGNIEWTRHRCTIEPLRQSS